jgi:hypothetical protein
MPSQPLAFAELLLGGVLVTSAIQNKPIAATLKGEAGPAIESKAAASAGGGTGGGGAGGAEPEAAPNRTAPPPGKPRQKGNIPTVEKELEIYLKRPLTPKEKKEITAAEGNV